MHYINGCATALSRVGTRSMYCVSTAGHAFGHIARCPLCCTLTVTGMLMRQGRQGWHGLHSDVAGKQLR